MKRAGIFGGSFNPVHTAHLLLAEWAREEAGLEVVLFVPASQPPHKPDRRLAPAADRLEMLRLATAPNPAFRISTVELERDGPSYTLTTVRELRREWGEGWQLCLLLGADSVLELPQWWRAAQLVQEVEVIGLPRRGSPPQELDRLEETFGQEPAARIRDSMLPAPLVEISATEVRRRLRRGLSVRYMVPEAVRNYILEHGLYAGDNR